MNELSAHCGQGKEEAQRIKSPHSKRNSMKKIIGRFHTVMRIALALSLIWLILAWTNGGAGIQISSWPIFGPY